MRIEEDVFRILREIDQPICRKIGRQTHSIGEQEKSASVGGGKNLGKLNGMRRIGEGKTSAERIWKNERLCA